MEPAFLLKYQRRKIINFIMEKRRVLVMEKIRVMITDDHSLIREGLKQLLEFDGSIEIVGEASNGTECLEKLNECNPEVLLRY